MAADSAPEWTADHLNLVRLWLVEGLGPKKLNSLLEKFGSATAVLSAGAAQLAAVRGVGAELATAIRASSEKDAHDYLARMKREKCSLLLRGVEPFPKRLEQIADCPALLSIRGALTAADQVAVAIVGSRHCSAYGRRMAQQLARDLASRGITVVSGLARGIDSVAHRAAMEVDGRTLAVLASGLANIYPPEHVELADQVAKSGALISEAHLDGPPIGALFPQRNRIISGLSLGVIVIEAALRSGALSTANHALDQNRDVFALPGRVGDPASEGTNRLIQQGAVAVTKVEDVLEVLGPIELPAGKTTATGAAAPEMAPPNMTDAERKLWLAIGLDDNEFEDLIERTGLRASEASSSLLMMEMRRLVRRLPGNRYERVR